MKCPHCQYEIVSLRTLAKRSGIAYSTLYFRYERGLRGDQLLGPIDKRRSTTEARRKKRRQPRSQVSGLMRQFMGSAR